MYSLCCFKLSKWPCLWKYSVEFYCCSVDVNCYLTDDGWSEISCWARNAETGRSAGQQILCSVCYNNHGKPEEILHQRKVRLFSFTKISVTFCFIAERRPAYRDCLSIFCLPIGPGFMSFARLWQDVCSLCL